jgi:hypothetical protein
MRTWRLPLLLVLSCAVSAAASASSYRYETDDGTLAMTDDLKRIPARYRDRVEVVPDRSLWDHPRLTVVPRGATNQAVWTPKEASEAPSAIPALDDRLPDRPTVRVEIERGVWVELEADPEPEIEVYREYRWVDGRLRPHAVVRQGDRVLAVRRTW